jgi:hypothetical protein
MLRRRILSPICEASGMLRYRFLPALLLLLFLSPALGQERYYDEANGFSVQLPAGWKSKAIGDDPIEKACWLSPNEDAEASVMMMGEVEYELSGLVETYKEDLSPEQILHEAKIDLSGLDGYLLVTEEVPGIVTIHTMMVHSGSFYDFGVFTEMATYRANPDSFKMLGRTFRVEEGP